MKESLKIRLKLYKTMKPYDYMSFKASEDNPYTYHHIVKKCNGGEDTLENGAVLTESAHQLLHIMEYKDKDLYDNLNSIFIIINNQGYPPTKEQYELIDYLIYKFIKEHLKDTNSKGEVLIKEKHKRVSN